MASNFSIPVVRVGVDDAARALSCSARHIWRLIDGGQITPIREGRRVYVPVAEIDRLGRPAKAPV